jgi:hypothetical protein
MHFLAPLFLVGLLTIVVPIAIHLIGRSRARVIRFAAMDFLLASQKKVASRLRLRQILLLCARIGAIAAVPLVLARPFATGRADVPATVARAQSAVVVLDDSASMQWRDGRTSLFDRAQGRAREILGLLGRDSEVGLVLGSEGAEAPVAELSQDRGRVVRAIDALRPTLKAADLPLAIRRASQMFAAAAHSERRIFVITDGAAHAWDASGPPAPAAGAPEVVVLDVAEGQVPPNRGIVAAEVAPAPQLGARGVRLTAEIANFSDRPIKDLPVTLRIGDRPVARGLCDVPAHGHARKAFHHAFPAGGYYDVVLEIPEDAFASDDRRTLRVEVRKEARVLLVDGDPRTVRREDELFYLDTALRPGGAAESQLQVSQVTLDALPRKLSDWDVIFLCNAKAPAAPQAAALRAFVEQGGGLFISAGDNVDPDAYQSALGDLLPQPLKGARMVAAEKRPEGESGLENEGPAERLGRLDRRHPMLQIFPPDPTGLRSARFYRLMLLSPLPDTASRRTLLRFENGAPALVEAEIGSGRVLLLTSTVDRDWTDLPIRPGFLPLMQQAARYLARSPMREPEPAGLVGRPHLVPIAADDARIEVTTPSGAHKLYDRSDLAGRRELGFAETSEIGVYHVAAAVAGQTLQPRAALDFAVNLDPKESDFTKIRSAGRPGDSAGPAEARKDAPTRRIELWHGLAGALLLFLLVEGALTRRG